MKKKNLRYLSVVLLAVCLGCKPEKDGVFYLDPAPVFEAKPNPLAPDSINAFRPAIGTPHVTRAFPFGTAGQPAGVRLLEVFEDPGSTNIYYKDKTTYLYTPTKGLIKKTRQTTSGIIWDINSYDSGAGERVQIATEVNNGAAYASGSLEKNQLGLIGTTQFEPTAEEKSWILRT